MQVFKIDDDGFYIADIILNRSDELPDDVVWVKPPSEPSFYKSKWDGQKWIEGATQEYINSLTSVVVEPSEIDILKEQVATQQAIIEELLFEVIPSLLPTEEEMI